MRLEASQYGEWQAEPGWQQQAACKGLDPEVFYPTVDDQAGNELALMVCRRCIVKSDCLADAYRLDDVQLGIRGGQTQIARGGPNTVESFDDSEKGRYCTQIIGDLIEQPQLFERLTLVLPTTTRGLFDAIVQAKTEATDEAWAMRAEKILEEAGKGSSTLRPSEANEKKMRQVNHIVDMGSELLAGTFDYQQWARSRGPQLSPSALLFLCRSGAEVSADAPLGDLQAQALGILKRAAQGKRKQSFSATSVQLLIDVYGLTGPPQDFHQKAKESGKSANRLYNFLFSKLEILRQAEAA